ncbi:hypothetical protein IAT38_000052 [Cryptococcus sp. DSM 104549]
MAPTRKSHGHKAARPAASTPSAAPSVAASAPARPSAWAAPSPAPARPSAWPAPSPAPAPSASAPPTPNPNSPSCVGPNAALVWKELSSLAKDRPYAVWLLTKPWLSILDLAKSKGKGKGDKDDEEDALLAPFVPAVQVRAALRDVFLGDALKSGEYLVDWEKVLGDTRQMLISRKGKVGLAYGYLTALIIKEYLTAFPHSRVVAHIKDPELRSLLRRMVPGDEHVWLCAESEAPQVNVPEDAEDGEDPEDLEDTEDTEETEDLDERLPEPVIFSPIRWRERLAAANAAATTARSAAASIPGKPFLLYSSVISPAPPSGTSALSPSFASTPSTSLPAASRPTADPLFSSLPRDRITRYPQPAALYYVFLDANVFIHPDGVKMADIYAVLKTVGFIGIVLPQVFAEIKDEDSRARLEELVGMGRFVRCLKSDIVKKRTVITSSGKKIKPQPDTLIRLQAVDFCRSVGGRRRRWG